MGHLLQERCPIFIWMKIAASLTFLSGCGSKEDDVKPPPADKSIPGADRQELIRKMDSMKPSGK